MEPIRIFVGSDERQERAERVLDYSIRKNTDAEVEITFMRCGEGVFDGWNMGRTGDMPEWRRSKWPTNFSNFRIAVPALAGFEGHAIYLDSDMMVFGDIAELYQIRQGAYTTTSRKRSEVGVIDCAAFKDIPWMQLDALMASSESLRHYRVKLWEMGLMTAGVPEEWNHLDNYVRGRTKLLHFTDMRTQPWKPWPERFDGYQRAHRDPGAVSAWKAMEQEAEERLGITG